MQVCILIAIPNFCLQSCAVMMLCRPVIWTECAHKPPFYIPFGAEKVQSENKKTQRGRISKHTTSKEALLHHMTVSTTSTRVRSEVSGFTSGRGSTRTEVHNPGTEREPAWPRACARCKGQRKGKRETSVCPPLKLSDDRSVALPTTTPSTRCLSSNDPDAEARTSRSRDINSSPCVTKLWPTALLDTQLNHKLCQHHTLFQSKHGYKTGSHRSPAAVCGCYSRGDYHF